MFISYEGYAHFEGITTQGDNDINDDDDDTTERTSPLIAPVGDIEAEAA
jgi:hypothetical protein